MKSLLAVSLLAGVAFVAGCASQGHPVVLDSVGPSSPRPTAASPTGALVVYSAYDSSAEFSDIPPLRLYTDYRILSEDGKLLQIVRNNNGDVIESPAKVELPVGKYRILAHANGYKAVTVPVVLLAGQVTTVHLEGGASWPDNAALVQSDPVRLPNGEIVGWRAPGEMLSKH